LKALLRDALERSRFLIVIGSLRARNSRWVNQEIAIFRSLIWQEIRFTKVIKDLEVLNRDYPENLQCMESLRVIYALLSGVLKNQGRREESQPAYDSGKALVVPITIGRLKAWSPNTATNLQGALLEPGWKQHHDQLKIWKILMTG
jgi:hypothetical protein